MTLVFNGLIIDNKDVLFDIRVGVYAFIRKDVVENLWEKTGVKRMRL